MEQNVSLFKSLDFIGFIFTDTCYYANVAQINFRCFFKLKCFVCVWQVNRLEGQVSRYKAAADNSEKVEDELKAEKRKLQREV